MHGLRPGSQPINVIIILSHYKGLVHCSKCYNRVIHTGKSKILKWPGLRQYFEFWARQYFEQPDTTNLHVTSFICWAGPKLILGSTQISKSVFCTTSTLNFPVSTCRPQNFDPNIEESVLSEIILDRPGPQK